MIGNTLKSSVKIMSDEERLNYLAGMLVEAASVIKDLAEEVSEYRAIDREEKFLNELSEITGKDLR